MSLSLLSVHTCSFGGCAQNFATLYDLIAHIEFVHIPLIEEDHRQKTAAAAVAAAAAAAAGEETRVNVAPNLPLSCFQRVFPTPYRPTPCRPEVVKVSFNHYRKRVILGNPVSSVTANQNPEDDQGDSNQADDIMEECLPGDPEMRFRCSYVDCNKRFRNPAGLRIHMRSSHGISSGDDLSGAVVTAEGVIPQPGYQPPAAPSPTKYAASRPYKCQQCSKRYKTTQGLQNHVSHSHQKPNSTSSQSDPPSPSPAVVAQLITQARAHGQHQQAAQAQAAAERANLAAQHSASSQSTQSVATTGSSMSSTSLRPPPLPVSVAAHQPALVPPAPQLYVQPNAPLPVRSIHVQPSRVVSQPQVSTHPAMQTTGQILHEQMMRQRQAQKLQQQQQQAQSAQYQTSQTRSLGMEGDKNEVFSAAYSRSPHSGAAGNEQLAGPPVSRPAPQQTGQGGAITDAGSGQVGMEQE